MKIDKLCLTNWRNIASLEMIPDEGVNIIYGDNAQGKTNLMEAIWMFTGARSFRGGKDTQFIRFGESESRLQITFQGAGRQNTAELIYGPKKKMAVNDIPLKGSTELSGRFCCVVFSPEHLSLVKDGPSERRRFLDGCICQMLPNYMKVLSEYQRVLQQRASLLRDAREHAALLDTLDIWDHYLAQYGSYILLIRKRFVEKLQRYAEEIYRGLSSQKERLTLSLQSNVDLAGECSKDKLEQIFLEKLLKSRGEDLRLGVTSVGVHRDDLLISIDEKNARQYASQGQQRSCVLTLKLAESGILQEKIGENPIILFDDVMSELDQHRRDFLLNYLGERQTFMTCCEKGYFSSLQRGKVFWMQNGQLFKDSQKGEA